MKKYFLIFLTFSFVSLFSNPTMESLIYKLRDPQTNKKEFRQTLKKVGEYLAYEISNDLNTKNESVLTLLNENAYHNIVDEDVVLITILRAGLPLFNGMLDVFSDAESGFFAMQRNEKTLKASIDYVALPDLNNKTVIIADTMLATGGSMLDAIKIIEKRNPKKIILASAIAAIDGIKRIKEYNPDILIYAAYIDPVLNDIGYIVPGLGDAGDRCFGTK